MPHWIELFALGICKSLLWLNVGDGQVCPMLSKVCVCTSLHSTTLTNNNNKKIIIFRKKSFELNLNFLSISELPRRRVTGTALWWLHLEYHEFTTFRFGENHCRRNLQHCHSPNLEDRRLRNLRKCVWISAQSTAITGDSLMLTLISGLLTLRAS